MNCDRVVGMAVTPAFAKSLVFTVVTRNEESNGMPISWLFEMNVSSWGRSARRPDTLKYLLSG